MGEPRATDVELSLESLSAVALCRRALRRVGVERAWLVGGLVRDRALGLEAGAWDVDLALPGSGERAAQAVAAEAGGSAFPLDEIQGSWRVSVQPRGTVDLVPLRAPSLEQDLRGRDFTMNAVAFDVLGGAGISDPLGGLDDLRARRLVPCSSTALRDDPLRVLRAYRFRFGLGLHPSSELPGLVAEAAPGLTAVSPERVRTELFAVLGLARGADALRALLEDGGLILLFPFISPWRGFDQGPYHAHDLLEHSLRTVAAAEALAAEPQRLGFPEPERLRAHLADELEAGVTRVALLKLSAFLHDVAKPETLSLDGARRRFLGHEVQGGLRVRRVLAGLRVGRRARATAQQVVGAHLRLFGLAHQARPTRAARLRYARDLGSDLPEAVLLSVADEVATGPEPPALAAVQRAARELLGLFWEKKDRGDVAPPLLRGRDLLADLGLDEGPAVGRLLRQVGEAESRGEVETRAEALALARRLARKEP